MDNPNLLNCLTFNRKTLPLSSTLSLFINLSPFLPSFLFLPSHSSSLYLFLLLYLPLFIFAILLPLCFSLPPFLPPSISFLLIVSSFLSPTPPSHTLPFLYFASLLVLHARSIVAQDLHS